MTKIVIFIVLAFSLSTYSQTSDRGYTVIIGVSIDPSMATVGPYNNKPNDIGATFNGEFRIGVEKLLNDNSGFRLSGAYEIHPAIYYEKMSFELAYMLSVWRFTGYLGFETGQIFRDLDELGLRGKPEVSSSTNWFNPGVNAELQYKIMNYIYLGANVNYFRAESALIVEGKKTRWDVMIGLTFKF